MGFLCIDPYGSKWLLELQLLSLYSSCLDGEEREREKDLPLIFKDASWKLYNQILPLLYWPEVSCLTQLIARGWEIQSFFFFSG